MDERQQSVKATLVSRSKRVAKADINVNPVNDEPSRYVVPSEAVVAALTDPEARRQIREILDGRLLLEIAPKALKILNRILNGDKAVTKLQFEAAKDALARAGFVPPKALEQAGSLGKSIGEKSSSEIRDFIAQAQNALADRARQVVDMPKEAPKEDAKSLGLLD